MRQDRLQQLTELLKDSPEDPFLLYAIALEHQANKNIEVAVEHFEQLLALHPDYLPAYYQLGGLYAQSGETMKAEETYHRGILLAQAQKDQRTLSELRSALDLL